MPTGLPDLEIRLRLAEKGLGLVKTADLKKIRNGLSDLFREESGWTSKLNIERHGSEHEIVFEHRSESVPDSQETDDIKTCSDIVYSLAHTLCDETSALSLGKISKDVKNIIYMPWMQTSREPVSRHLQKLFNRHLILFTLQRTIGDAYFEDMDAEARISLTPERPRWFLGPLKVGVFSSDFIDLFGNLASLLPLQDDLPQETKEATLLRILKRGSELAPVLRAACTVSIENLDEDGIGMELRMADYRVKKAMAAASRELQKFLDNFNGTLDESTGRIIDQIKTSLTQSIKDLHEAREIASRASERINADFDKTKWQLIGGGVVLICGLGFMLFGAPVVGGLLSRQVGTMLVTDVLGLGGTTGGSLAIIRPLIYLWGKGRAEKYIKGLDDLHVRSLDIYAFLALAALRSTGELTNDDEKLLKFALEYAAIFSGTDVLREWNKPEYILARVGLEHNRLKDSIQRFKVLFGDTGSATNGQGNAVLGLGNTEKT